MINGKKNLDFEKFQSENQDLTFRYLTSVIKRRNPELQKKIASERGFTDEEGKYTNLAFLMSDQNAYTIKLAVYDGNNKKNLKSQEEIGGSLIRQLVVACSRIDELSGVGVDYRNEKEAVLRKNIPAGPVREAIVNALAHRNYSFRGSIHLNLFDNRLEIISPGGVHSDISFEAVQMGLAFPVNEGLVRILEELRIMLNLGSGINRIKAEYIGEQIPARVMAVTGAFMVILPNVNCGTPGHEENPADFCPTDKQEQADQEKRFKEALSQAFELRTAAEEARQLADQAGVDDAGSNQEAQIYGESRVFAAAGTGGYQAKDEELTENIQYDKVVAFIKKNGSIKRRQAEDLLEVGQSRALTVLSRMQEAGIIRLVGVGRTSEYRLV